jgi:hypothetical protein
MKTLYATLIATLCAMSAPTLAQTSIEKAPDPITKTPAEPPSGKTPDPGLSNLPDAPRGAGADTSGDSVTNTGVVKVPPSTGTENVIKPPKNIDPGITEPTDDIDRKNRQKSEEKQGLK